MKPYNLRTRGAVRCGHCGLWFVSLTAWQGHRYGPFGARACMDERDLRFNKYRKDTKGRWKQPRPGEYDYNRKPKPPPGLDKPLRS